MKVYSFSKVIYDGYLSLDLFFFMVRQKFTRIFKFLKLLPSGLAFITKQITMSELIERFYTIVIDNITISELNLFKANSMHKVDLQGFGIEPDDKDCLIITGEPSFLVDLFIDRNHYKVACSEFNLKSKKFEGKINLEKHKIDSIRAAGIARINQLFVHSLKDQALLKMSDYIFIYRGSALIDYSTFKPKLRDKLDYDIMNKNTIIFAILAFILMLGTMVLASMISIFADSLLGFLISYGIWFIIMFMIASSLNKENPEEGNSIFGFILGVIPNFLALLALVLVFNISIGIAAGVVFVLGGIITYPLLLFMIRFYRLK